MAPPKIRKYGKTPKVRRAPRAAAKITPEQLEEIRKELELLPGLIRTHYTKWTNGAKDFQLECMGAQKLGKDVLLHASTGAGKTGIAAGPHLLPSSKGKVTLMVSPLLSLHDEQVSTFQTEFGLKATAINSANGGCTKEIMEKVVTGEWQIVMLSPEMLLSRRFIDGVLRKPAFGSRCLSVFIDEAHCISHWGASFRKKYASIGIIRAFLPRTTPIIAVTATLTPRVHQDLIVKLQFDPKNYMFCNIGNDRPNVSQIIRSMEHPANSYRDVDFMVDPEAEPKDIKLSFLYSDDIADGGKLVDHLNGRVNSAYRSRGLVRPYNAGMSREYRVHVMALFKAGIIRILVCTDAAGMGCDIPNVELVVQWKLPKNLSSWIQRAGRAARGPVMQGMAVMLVEKSAFEASTAADNPDNPVPSSTPPIRGRGRGRGRGTGGRGGSGRRGGKNQGKEYAEIHGQKRGWYRGVNDSIKALEDSDAEIPVDAPAEGLYAVVQATICRRIILSRVFKNAMPAVPKEACCDICNPTLFDHVRPSKPVRAVRQKGIRKGPPVDSVRQSLFKWRREVKKMDYPNSIFAAHAILDDATCELLSSIGPVDDIVTLEQLLKSSWSRWAELGNRLYVYMRGLKIPPLPPPPTRKKKPSAAPQPSTSSIPRSAPAAPRIGQPSHNTAATAKRKHAEHSTRFDDSAPPTQRSRTEQTPQTPQMPRPTPRPAYRGFCIAAAAATASIHLFVIFLSPRIHPHPHSPHRRA
ncbi:ATP-dependent DNA helicase Q-like 3 [Mycena venus]|uniref:DNA 3'-5' helicase n=1 Tax=Mycena venus TaxID=2733690 RepID=A0A8H7CYG2_9AGAR|nr:ATP-dependent DNA helicase Q-like 3 [Mycena venus]